jgi:hypothetical protein
MSFRIPAPAHDPKPQSREMAFVKADGLHDASLHAEMLGADDKRVIWLRPAGPIKVKARP